MTVHRVLGEDSEYGEKTTGAQLSFVDFMLIIFLSPSTK
jgi:hypothetical protein